MATVESGGHTVGMSAYFPLWVRCPEIALLKKGRKPHQIALAAENWSVNDGLIVC